jgi:DNA-binding XRE family transcriptional regulator
MTFCSSLFKDTYNPWTFCHHLRDLYFMEDETEIKITFGSKVRLKRKEAGLSQEALADLCDLDRTYIGGVERGERNISLVNIFKISNALKISPGELLHD